jgi:3-deoxy-D-manno-octulosonic-acid transferase
VYAAYSLALAIALVLAAPWFLWKGRRTGKYVSSFRERMGRLPSPLDAAGRASVWIHAVSVGEVFAARPLLPALRKTFPDLAVLVSTTTTTGRAVAAKSLDSADGLFYAPFDLPRPVRKAFDAARPRLLVLMETEIWPNLVHEGRRRGARVAIVNGRLSERSFRGYRRARGLVARVLREIDLFLMQGDDDARRILALGAPPERVRTLGNLKFDAARTTPPSEEIRRLFDTAPRRPLWVAGSTMPGEEELVLASFRRVRESVPDLGLVLAPRHPERSDAIPALVEAAGFSCVRRTRLEPGAWRNGTVVVLDTLGELTQVYGLASVVFVGGSLVPTGGHNVLEPAAAGKAVVVGPHMENFRDIARRFRAEDALVEVASADDLAASVASLLTDARRRDALGARARDLVERNRGAVDRTAEALAGLLA